MFLPSAWPSQTMLERFPFVRQAVMRPWHFYFITLADFSPLHLFGLLFATLLIGICFLKIFFGKIKLIDLLTSKYRRFYLLMVFWLWPFCFVAGLMVLGLAGGGYQQRFLTPMLAGTAFLTSIVICDVFLSIPSNVVVVLVSVVMMWCLWSSLCLSFYFGVLFAPLHAEVSFGIESMISLMLSSSFIIMQSHEEMLQLFEFMKHFGFKVR